jgi:hypothetical protein
MLQSSCMERLKTRATWRSSLRSPPPCTSSPGGGRAANTFEAALWVAFGIGIGYLGLRLYREHRVALHGLGDRHRGLLYGALAGGVFLLAARSRMWEHGRRRARLVRAGGAGRLRAARGLPLLAHATERRAQRRLLSSDGMAATEAVTTGERRASLPSSAARCPTSPACTCSATARGG